MAARSASKVIIHGEGTLARAADRDYQEKAMLALRAGFLYTDMNIAVFLPNWIGDAVMATPAVAALRERYRNADMVAVMKPYISEVFTGCYWFDEVLHTNSGRWADGLLATAARIRSRSIDVAVLFPNSFRSALTAYLGGCRRIIGYARDRRSWLLSDGLPSIVDDDGQFVPSPVIDSYNRLATHVGCTWPGHRMKLYTDARDAYHADLIWAKFALGQRETIIALNPGAAFGSAKHWPPEHFAQLARELAGNSTAILVLCGPGEREMAKGIVERAAHPDVFSLANEDLSIGLTKACVKRADLLITTDSGPRHFAAAFETPVITLFGPTHIEWTETYFSNAIHLQEKVSCGPCQKRVCPLDHRCMTQLSPERVARAAQVLLARTQNGVKTPGSPFRKAG